VASAIAVTATGHVAGTATSAAALDHGFRVALYALLGLLVAGALITVRLVRPKPATARVDAPAPETALLRDAA
jgi:hypothetical protein